MKFPSLHRLNEESLRAAHRFPLSLLSSISATILLIYIVEKDSFTDNLPLLNLLLTLALGIPLFFSVEIFTEKNNLSFGKKIFFWGLGLIALALIYLSFPTDLSPGTTRAPYIRYVIYNLALHLTVSFVPFLEKGKLEGFWNYNKTLFIRFVMAAFFSQVISTGITLAFGALDLLFDVKMDPKTYTEIFILTYGIFNTWYFLAGIPRDFESDDSIVSYPKGLKIFTQFILIPLLLLYLAILYAYGAKIMITWDWPRGIVTYLIIAISVLGIFTNLLLFPYQKEKEGGWIKGFYKAFYYLLLPLTVLLFIAIGIRIQDYGLTVNRYIIVLMGIWLGIISLYFILGFKSIKTVPISLAAAMILASFGPWGMFSWSERHQVNRLESILTTSGILENGKIKQEVSWEKTTDSTLRATTKRELNTLSNEQLNEVNSILHYLEDYHGMDALFPWIAPETAEFFTSKEIIEPSHAQLMAETLGIKYVPPYEAFDSTNSEQNSYTEFSAVPTEEVAISGYDYLIRFVIYPSYEKGEVEELLSGPDYSFSKPKTIDEDILFSWRKKEINLQSSAFMDVLTQKHGAGVHPSFPQQDLSTLIQSDSLEIKVMYKKIAFLPQGDGKINFDRLSGIILIKNNIHSVP
jgi:hypothetical protein